MKNFVLLILLFAISLAQAANITDNNLKLGNGTTTGNKKITFDTGAGTSNKKLEVDAATGAMTANMNTVTIGDGASTTKKIIFDTGAGAGNAYLGWDSTLSAPVFSKDGTLAKKLGSGSGGGGAGITFNDNGDIEDGITQKYSYSVGTVTELTTTNALVGEKSARLDFAALNDYFRSSYFVLPKGLYGSACELRFKYLGGDANTYVKVETEAGTVLGQFQTVVSGAISYGLPTKTTTDYESVFFKCPTQADITSNALHANIRLVFYQGTASNAASLDVDSITQGELIGLVESTTSDIFSAKVSATDVVSDENADWINGDCTNASAGLATCNFTAGVFQSAPTCLVTPISSAAVRTGRLTAQATTASVTVMTDDGTSPGNLVFNLVCFKSGADAKQSVQVYKSIPKVSQNVNSLSAYVNGAASITSKDVDFLSGCTKGGTGVYNCTFIPGVFSAVPSILAVADTGGSTSHQPNLVISSLTTSGFRVDTKTVATPADYGFWIHVDKQGADFKLPTVQPIVIGQVTNSAAESGLTNVRTESCKFNDSGTSSIDTSSGLCAGWIASITKGGAGENTVAFAAGVFSSVPVCQVSPLGTDNINCFARDTVTTSSLITNCENTNTAGNVNIPFVVSCTGKR